MNQMKEIYQHFKRTDRKIYDILLNGDIGRLPTKPDPDEFFLSLCETIISQQLATKAAAAIITRFTSFVGTSPQPDSLLAIESQSLRDIGISWAKVNAIKDLSRLTAENKLLYSAFHEMSNTEITQNLLQVKGIGEWTAEMFLIFTLGREDIFSLKDLGLRTAVSRLYRIDRADLQAIEKLSKSWAPFRSYASLALWQTLNNK